jgi:hypothetical protein
MAFRFGAYGALLQSAKSLRLTPCKAEYNPKQLIPLDDSQQGRMSGDDERSARYMNSLPRNKMRQLWSAV